MFDNNIETVNQQFQQIIEELVLSLKARQSDEPEKSLQMIEGLKQTFQIMLRLNSDAKNNKVTLEQDEISKIGDYALNLLDEISIDCASRGMQDQMLQLHRLSLPIVRWLKQYNGQLLKLDIVVNAIASYANTIQDCDQLKLLCSLIEDVVDVVDGEIKQDLEATNPMRPWRILHLNWGIVATRTHSPKLMQHVFEKLAENIPTDSQQFFHEGMQQMDIVGYPDEVREVMKRFADGVGTNSVLH